MQLNRLLLREPVHDQQLIERIAQRLNRQRKSSQTLFVHLKRSLPKTGIDQQSLDWSIPKNGSRKIKLETAIPLRQLPCCARIEEAAARSGSEVCDPLDTNIDVGNTRWSTKRFEGRDQCDVFSAPAVQLNRHT